MTKQIIQSNAKIISWKQDMHTLGKELPRLHKNLFYKRKQKDMEQEFSSLEQQIPFLNDSEILVGLTRWIASAGDAHTRIGRPPTIVYPLAFYWFDEGIYVTYTAPEYNFMLHGCLEEIEGKSINSVIEMLRSLIPYENKSQLKEEFVHMLISPELLYGINLVSHFGEINYKIRTAEGTIRDVFVQPSTEKIEHFFGVGPIGSYGPLYTRNKTLFYFFDYIEKYKTLYFQYNHCIEDPVMPHKTLIKELLTIIKERPIKKLVIDLRYNMGGDSKLLQPFINKLPDLKSMKYFNKLYVIIGRATFSSGMLHAINIRKTMSAELLGQPTGGKPNHFGEIRGFQLPNSGLNISYSTRFFRFSKNDTPSLMPDYEFPISFTDYIKTVDPIIEYILNQKQT